MDTSHKMKFIVPQNEIPFPRTKFTNPHDEILFPQNGVFPNEFPTNRVKGLHFPYLKFVIVNIDLGNLLV